MFITLLSIYLTGFIATFALIKVIDGADQTWQNSIVKLVCTLMSWPAFIVLGTISLMEIMEENEVEWIQKDTPKWWPF